MMPVRRERVRSEASNMVEKLRFDGIDDPIVNAIDTQNIDYTALSKLAIDFSDGIIIAQEGVAPELIDYAKASGSSTWFSTSRPPHCAMASI